MRGRPRKLNDAQLAEVRDWHNLMTWVRALPTATQMAARLGISKQALYLIANGYTYKVSAERKP